MVTVAGDELWFWIWMPETHVPAAHQAEHLHRNERKQ
jgi:hypothetical protein